MAADIETFWQSRSTIFETTIELGRIVDTFNKMSPPVDERELSRRVDAFLQAVWPEFRTTTLEAELLRRQNDYYGRRNPQLLTERNEKREIVADLRESLTRKPAELAYVTERLAESRRIEARATELAIGRINDRTSERNAIATLLVLAPNPRVTLAQLSQSPRVAKVPGELPLPRPPMPNLSAGQPSQPGPPTEPARLTINPPNPGAPLAQKFSVLQTVSRSLQKDTRDVRWLRPKVSELAAEYDQLVVQLGELRPVVDDLSGQMQVYNGKLAGLRAEFDVSTRNTWNANKTIFAEVLRDMALDEAADRLREVADEIAGSRGVELPVPQSGSQGLLHYARRKGRALLPIEGHATQWDAFIEVQEKTLNILNRAQGHISEAAQLAATASPEEMDAYLERVFASVRWDAVDLARSAGSGVMPEGEKGSKLQDAFGRVIGKLRTRQTGEE